MSVGKRRNNTNSANVQSATSKPIVPKAPAPKIEEDDDLLPSPPPTEPHPDDTPRDEEVP